MAKKLPKPASKAKLKEMEKVVKPERHPRTWTDKLGNVRPWFDPDNPALWPYDPEDD